MFNRGRYLPPFNFALSICFLLSIYVSVEFEKMFSNEEIRLQLEKLWEAPVTNKFMTGFVKLINHHPLKEVVLESLSVISGKCYQQKYGEFIPHALMGFQAAWGLGEFFHSRNRVLPIAEMLWYAVNEARSPSVDFRKAIGVPPRANELHFESFQKIVEGECETRQMKEAFRYFVFLSRDPEIRKKIFSYLIHRTLRDEASVGHKLISLTKLWEFSQQIEWQNVHPWYPLLHYLIEAPERVEHFPLVADFYEKNPLSFPQRQESHKNFLKILEPLRESIFNDEKEKTLEKIKEVVSKGESLSSLSEVLKLISVEIVYESSFDQWPTAIHGFHYVYGLATVLQELEPQDQYMALLMAALFLKKMAVLSKPFSKTAMKPPQTIDEKNRPLYFLEYAISRGDISKALGALDELLKEKPADSTTLETLAFLASKNLYTVLYGHDIKFAYTCLKSYKNATYPQRKLYLFALVKLLAEMPKEPTIYNAVMNSQEIKAFGYYSV